MGKINAIFLSVSLAAATVTTVHAAGTTCQLFQPLAIAKLPEKLDPGHSQSANEEWQAWAALEAKSVANGSGERFFIQRTMRALGQPSYQVRGWRRAQGWRLEARVDHPTQRLQHRWSKWRSVSPPPSSQAKLDALWADGCLWNAPHFLAATLPLASGGWVPSFDGPTTFFELRGNMRGWDGAQISWRLGKPAELAAVVLRAAFGSSANYPLDPSVMDTGIVWADERGEHQLTPPSK